MTFPFPYGGITVTVERPTYDRFNDVSGWAYHTIEECVDYPTGSDEAQPNVVVLHEPGEATPPPLNSALRRKQTYSVLGVPKDWVHAMTGWHPGKTVELERVT
jgi:hypothetical protein